MLGDALFLYAASRAASTAVEDVTRRATWTAGAAAFLLSGLVFALIVAFWVAEQYLGARNAAGAIAVACLVIGVVCLFMPTIIERIERAGKKHQSPMATTVSVVEDEAKEAVDYFGALQVVGAAFLFGLGAARRFKR